MNSLGRSVCIPPYVSIIETFAWFFYLQPYSFCVFRLFLQIFWQRRTTLCWEYGMGDHGRNR